MLRRRRRLALLVLAAAVVIPTAGAVAPANATTIYCDPDFEAPCIVIGTACSTNAARKYLSGCGLY